MPLVNSYVFYNNKGGVGKSTLCFHLATEYAHRHANQMVLLIDACPQASLSSTIYNDQAHPNSGIDFVSNLSRQGVFINGAVRDNLPRNICGYLASATSHSLDQIVRPEEYRNFLVRPRDKNDGIPPNIKLLAGDGSLEVLCRSLDYTRRGQDTVHDRPWQRITTLLKNFVDNVTNQPMEDGHAEWVVFIDTNPAFTIYTEMAITAANRLIIPCTADGYSLNALLAMFELIYGWVNPNPTFSSYAEYTFARLARDHNIQPPKVHLFISNRTTQYASRSSTAFRSVQVQTAVEAFRFYQGELGPEGVRFPASKVFTVQQPAEAPVTNVDDFGRAYFRDMQDMHQTAVVCSLIGRPLYAMKGTRLGFGDELFRVNFDEKVRNYQAAIHKLAEDL